MRCSADPLTYSCLIGKTDLISIPDRLYVGAFLRVDRSDRQLRSLRPTPTESEIRNLSLGPIPTGSLKSRSDRAREGRRDRPIANSDHESSFDFGSDRFIDLDEQEEGGNCNEDSGDDDSFETLDPNIVSQLIVDEQLTKHLFNANRKQENWGELVTAVSSDLAFLSINARGSNSTSISAENASSDSIPHIEFQPSARRPFNQSGSHYLCEKSCLEIPAISFEGILVIQYPPHERAQARKI